MKLSVLTPTLNPRPDFLARVLRALDAQTLPKDQWEYIVVDNGSDDPLAGRLDLSWHPDARVVVEPQRGLTRARIAGMSAARHEVVVLVDDDVVLAPDYLERVLDYYAKYPFLGVIGGCGPAEYEVEPPAWMHVFLGLTMDERYSLNAKPVFQYALVRQAGPWVPPGSAMTVRREITKRYVEMVLADDLRLNLDRKDGGLAGAGDTDLAYTAIDLGWACGVSPELAFTHLIAKHRLDPRYLERLLYSTGYYSARLLIHRGWKKPNVFPRKTLRNWLSEKLRVRLMKSWPKRCWIAYARGHQHGAANLPPDPFYR